MGRATRVLAEGIYFGEGPRWRDGRLWFSDFYAHAVKSVSLAGDLRTEFEIDDQPSGLGWMPDGEDGRTLFMLAGGANSHDAATKATGKVLVAEVGSPHAGLP